MEIIITRITNYKEKDGIIDAICKDGKTSFLVRSLFDPKNKNAALNNVLTVADVETSEGKYKYPIITGSKIVLSPINPHADLKYMSVIMGMAEAINQLLNDEEQVELYEPIIDSLKALKNDVNPYEVFIPFLAKVLSISGYDFDVNQCVFCGGKKQILTFSFDDGGFICQNCYLNDIPKPFNKNQLIALRQSFFKKTISIEDKLLKDDELSFIIDKFLEFIYNSFGYKMKVKELIK